MSNEDCKYVWYRTEIPIDEIEKNNQIIRIVENEMERKCYDDHGFVTPMLFEEKKIGSKLVVVGNMLILI